MAQTPEEFLSKNLKWVTLILIVLFMYKCTQSCNRKTDLDLSTTKYEHIVDSITTKYVTLKNNTEDSIKKLNFELRLESDHASSANERAKAIQNAVEKIKANTTITVKGVEEIKENKK